MNDQYLQYVREEIMRATIDSSGRTKGQLTALVEQLQFTNDRYPRKRQFIVDSATGQRVRLMNPPVTGRQSRAKGEAIPLIIPDEFLTASWRRAIGVIDERGNAWIKWNYTGDIDFKLQVTIVQHGWRVFSESLKGKRVAAKTIKKLRTLIWLAAQDVRAELAGRDALEHCKLAELAGVEDSNWCKNYSPYWRGMRDAFLSLDRDSLLATAKARSQQKSAYSHSAIAKVN